MRSRSVAALAVLSMTILLPSSALAERGAASFTWSADCTELASGFSVPVENLAGYVPSGYRILGEESGSAMLNVGIGRCTDMVVDGKPAKDAFTGFVAVFIESPEGGVARYFLWSSGTSKPVDRRLRSLGLPSIAPKVISLEIDRSSSTISAAGSVPRVGLDQGGYGISMSSVQTTPAPASLETSYWHDGPCGTVEATFSVTFADEPAGPATLRAEPGTVMAGLIGGEVIEGGALLARFDFDATFELAAQTEREER
jgi:hypothetical protein